MPLTLTPCPPAETWADFYAGKSDPTDLPDHLDGCAACRDLLDGLADATADRTDELVAGLRAVPEADPFEAEPECRAAVERVGSLVADDELSVPERVGEYRILERIGRGGMGAVYRAVHARLGRDVALKVVAPGRARDAAALARFRREATALGKLDHPNVVRATDAGEADGLTFLVMDLVDGIDLARLVKAAGPLHTADACELARQAAAGLQHLGSHGLVHRDVKPSNVMLDRRGGAKVLDLGLAASPAADALTGVGCVVGTLDFLAPEQADPAAEIDARADVYGLGCTLFFLLTGRPPYSGSSGRAKLLGHTTDHVPCVRDVRPDLPASLAAVVARMMATRPADRFASPADAAAALAPFCVGHDLTRPLAAVGLEPLAVVRQAVHAEKRRWVAALVAVLLVAGGVVAGLAALRQPVAQMSAVPQPVAEGDEPAPADAKTVYPVALLAFEERGVKDTAAKLGDLLFAKLAAKDGVFLVDRADIKKVFDEQQLGASGAVKADTAAKVGQLTGAKLLVTGSVVVVEKRMTLVAKLIGTESGRVVGASAEGAVSDDLGVLAGKLADALAEKLAKESAKLVPAPAKPVDRAAALAKKLGKGPRPVLSIRIAERHVGQPTIDPAAETELIRFAREAGFEIIDADQGGKTRADVVVTGEGFSESAGRVGGLVAVRARVEVKAVDRQTGKVLVADSRVAVVVEASELLAGKSALQAAAADLAEAVLPKLAANR